MDSRHPKRWNEKPFLVWLISSVESLFTVMGVRGRLSADSTSAAFACASWYTRDSSNGALAAGVFVSAVAWIRLVVLMIFPGSKQGHAGGACCGANGDPLDGKTG